MPLSKKLKNQAFEHGIIAPSILSADFSKLGEELASVERAGVEWIHVDVMDGHFVPNLTIGPVVVEALRPTTKSVLDCHLMVSDPEKWIGAFADAGADIITVHAEACESLPSTLAKIKEQGCLAGASVRPGTHLRVLEEVLDTVDLILIMSVNPGFGGQSFIPEVLDKVRKLVDLRGRREGGNPYLIQIDGGINAKTIGIARQAGVDVFVAGSAVFAQKDRKKALEALEKELANAN